MTQKSISELYQTTPQNITLHIKNIYKDGELEEKATCKSYLQVQKEGSRDVKREQKFYSFDMILAIGYRVRSNVGIHFRRWASRVLTEYTKTGCNFALFAYGRRSSLFRYSIFSVILTSILQAAALHTAADPVAASDFSFEVSDETFHGLKLFLADNFNSKHSAHRLTSHPATLTAYNPSSHIIAHSLQRFK